MLIQQLEEMAKLKLDQWNTQTRKTDSVEEAMQSSKVHHFLRFGELQSLARIKYFSSSGPKALCRSPGH